MYQILSFKIFHLIGLELKILYNFLPVPKNVTASIQASAVCTPQRLSECQAQGENTAKLFLFKIKL